MTMIQKTALALAGLTTLVALVLVIDRGGVIAWAACILGALLFAKLWRRPSPKDLWLSIALAGVTALAWIGVFKYVISSYESGEVVELAVDTSDGIRLVRLWVLDVDGKELIYYDAVPEVATSLLASTPLQLTRAGVVSKRLPRATRVDALPDAEANQLLEVMAEKYGDRMTAATVYYILLGVPRDRVSLVVDLVEIQMGSESSLDIEA